MDIATLGLRIENGQAVQAAQQTGAALDQLAVKGEKAAASTSQVGAAMQRQAAQAKDLISWTNTLREQFALTDATSAESVASFQKHVTALYQLTSAYGQAGAAARAEADAMLTQVAAARASVVANTAAGEAVQMHGLQLGRLNMELGTFIGRATGANTAATRLGAMIGGNVIGYSSMIAVLVGVSALLWVWDKLTDGMRKAKEEQDKLTESLEQWYDTQKRGAGAERQKELEAETASVAALTLEYQRLKDIASSAMAGGPGANYRGSGGYGAFGGIAANAAASDAQELAKKKAAMEKGYADLLKVQRDAAMSQRKQLDDDLATSAEYFKNDDALRTKALARRKDLANQVAYLRTAHPEDLKDINDLSDSIRNFDRALKDAAPSKDAIQAITDSMAQMALQTMVMPDQLAKLEAAQKSWAETMKDDKKSGAEYIKAYVQHLKDVAAASDAMGIAIREGAAKVAAANEKMLADAVAAEQKYSREMQNIWATGLERIVTNGTKSFQNFFDDVLRLFEQLMKKMQEAQKASGLGYQLLGIASSAIGGGIAGYQIGQQAGQSMGSLNGALIGAGGGAMAGAAIGSAVLPGVGTAIGAIVGGLAGLAGGLLGGAAAAKQRRDQEDQLRHSLQASVDQIKLQLGLITPLNAALDANTLQFQQLRDEVEKAYAGRKNQQEREAKLRELDALELQSAEKIRHDAAQQAIQDAQAAADALKQEAAAQEAATESFRRAVESLIGRAMAATGNGSGSSLALFDAQQRQQRYDETLAGRDPTYLALLDVVQGIERTNFVIDQQEAAVNDANAKQQAALDAQVQAAQTQVSLLQDSISKQQQLVDQTKQVVDSLATFQDSLKLNTGLTTLSPADQLAEARRQYDATLQQALGGNAASASQLPQAAQALLNASHAYNASGTGYVADFTRVQQTIAQVQGKFGNQLSVEQLILSALQSQLGTLQAQIDALNAAKDQAAKDAAAQIAALEAQRKAAQDAAAAQIAILQAQLAALIAMQNALNNLGNTSGRVDYTPPAGTPKPGSGTSPSSPSMGSPDTLSAQLNTAIRVFAAVGSAQIEQLSAISDKLEQQTTVTRQGFEMTALT